LKPRLDYIVVRCSPPCPLSTIWKQHSVERDDTNEVVIILPDHDVTSVSDRLSFARNIRSTWVAFMHIDSIEVYWFLCWRTEGRKEDSADCLSFSYSSNIFVRRHQQCKKISRCHITDRPCMLNIYRFTSMVTIILSSCVCKVIWLCERLSIIEPSGRFRKYCISFLICIMFYVLHMSVRITYAYITSVYLASAASPSDPLSQELQWLLFHFIVLRHSSFGI
jgi:hypothetical protein